MSHQPHVYGNWRGSNTQSMGLNARTLLQNNGLGVSTGKMELPGLWNPTTNRLGGPGTEGLIAVDDMLEVRVGLVVTLSSLLTLSKNPQLIMDWEISAANDESFNVITDQKLLSINTGDQPLTFSFPVYVGSTFIQNGMAINVKCSVPGISLGTQCAITKPSLVVIKHPR